MLSYSFYNLRKEVEGDEGGEEVLSPAITRMTDGDSSLRRGLPAVGRGALMAPCTVARAGTYPGLSPGARAILKAAVKRPCLLLGLRCPDVQDSLSPVPGNGPKMQHGFMRGPS